MCKCVCFFYMMSLALLPVSPAFARTFTEQTLECRGVLLVRDDGGQLHVQAQCRTDLRTFDLDLFPLLTPNQRNQITNIFDGLLGLVHANEAIPSPHPTVTP